MLPTRRLCAKQDGNGGSGGRSPAELIRVLNTLKDRTDGPQPSRIDAYQSRAEAMIDSRDLYDVEVSDCRGKPLISKTYSTCGVSYLDGKFSLTEISSSMSSFSVEEDTTSSRQFSFVVLPPPSEDLTAKELRIFKEDVLREARTNIKLSAAIRGNPDFSL